MCLRQKIKKSVENSLVQFVCEDEEASNGVCELLEVFESIIDGLKVPLKEENVRFLSDVLIPLHKARALPAFHQQLSKCFAKYVTKDSGLTTTIFEGVMKYWPMTNSTKEVNCLNELEELVEVAADGLEPAVERKVFTRLCKCISSQHFQVAEKGLMMLNNEKVIEIMTRNKEAVYPMLVGSLMENSESHWNSYISMLTLNSIKVLMDVDMRLFESASQHSQRDKEAKAKWRSDRELAWKALEDRTGTRRVLPPPPYDSIL